MCGRRCRLPRVSSCMAGGRCLLLRASLRASCLLTPPHLSVCLVRLRAVVGPVMVGLQLPTAASTTTRWEIVAEPVMVGLLKPSSSGQPLCSHDKHKVEGYQTYV